MRSKAAAIALAVAFSTTLTSAAVFMPQQAHAQSQRGYDMFYNDLAQDGRWVDHPRYGWVWYPTQVRNDWRPYSDGRWVWTDRHGWYWESNERFGWATYHYGRWGYDDQYGHIWVPGDEWAPAWVSFRDSDEAIGWAPLPPETLGMTLLALLAGGSSSSHYRYVNMSDSYYQPRWTFVPTRYFTDDRVYSHAYSWRDNDRYYRGSNNVTNYIQVNNYYVNRSIDPRRWESRTGRQVQTINVRDANSRDQWRDRDRKDERNISVFHPRIERDRDGRSAPPPTVRATANDKPVVQVQREWTAPEERRDRPNTRDEWRQRYSQGNDRKDNDNDRTDRERDGRPDAAKPGGATPATPATRATPADPGVNPATRATPATPATPNRNAQQPDRDRNDRGQQQRAEQERAQQERAQQQKAQQEKVQQQKAQQEKAQQDRAQQLKAQQDKAAQDRAQQQKAAQERAQEQKVQQQKVQQDRAQQQKATQQRQQQEKVQQQKAAQEKAQRARQPEQAAKPEPRQPEQRQQPQRKQEQRGNGTECPPNQPNCR